MSTPLSRLAEVAEGQWGLFTRPQAEQVDVGWTTLVRLVKGGLTERVGHGVYRIRGSGEPDHLALRVAWLQLAPNTPAWARFDEPELAVVSYASAASMYQLGDLRADIHEFTLPVRKQSRRRDVRPHRGTVPASDWIMLGGLPVTRAGRTIGDLVASGIDLETVARITADAVDRVLDYPRVISDHLAASAARFGFARGDGKALFDYLLSIADYKQRPELTVPDVA